MQEAASWADGPGVQRGGMEAERTGLPGDHGSKTGRAETAIKGRVTGAEKGTELVPMTAAPICHERPDRRLIGGAICPHGP